MKKKLTILFLSFLLITTTVLLINCNDNNSTAKTDSVTEDPAEKIKRGNYLANYVANCIDCHSQRDFNQFAGPVKPGTEGMGGEIFDSKVNVPGVIYAPNITPDTATGIGSWTDAELLRAITQGISKNGDTLFPLMPYPHYNAMDKKDIYDIIAYMRSLKPITNKVPQRNLFIPLVAAYPPMLKASIDSNKRPEYTDKISYGEYIVNSAACMECHTPMDKGHFQMDKMFAGGFIFDFGIFKVAAANITPDSTTGIGTWSEEKFLWQFQQFRDPSAYNFNPGKNNTIMPWTMFAKMDDFDIKAMYAYLRTVRPVKQAVVKYPK